MMHDQHRLGSEAWYASGEGADAAQRLAERITTAIPLGRENRLWDAAEQVIEWLLEFRTDGIPVDVQRQLSVRIRLALAALQLGDQQALLQALRLILLLTGRAAAA